MKHIFLLHDTKKHHDFEKIIQKVMNDLDYEVIYSASIHNTIRYIQKTSEKSRFYAVGGDGTLSGVIQPLVHSEHELVVLPLGTGNDFCRTLTKEKDCQKILVKSLNQPTQKIDVIQLNDMYYINSACFGVDSVIANHVHDTPNIPLVPSSKSYIISILQHVFKYKFDEVKVLSKGEIIFQGQVTLCTINNGQYYGGGFQIIPHASIQDGYMDICVVEKIPKAKIPYMLSLLLRHQLDDRKEVHYFKVQDASVICENDANIDGEEYKNSHYDFQIIPQSLNIVIEGI